MTEENVRDYNPFGVNTGLSQHIDTILYVNELNMNWQTLTPQQHYDYCFYSIRKMRREYGKWAKRPENADIELVMEYYDVNRAKALDYLTVLTEENMKVIRTALAKDAL